MTPSPGAVTLALALGPPVVLGVLMVSGRWSMSRSAWVAVSLTAGVSVWPFQLTMPGVAVAVGKGLWTGFWILLIVVPALLLFSICEHAGAMNRIGDLLGRRVSTPGRQLLLLAVAFPVFLQGVAGYGIPIALTAPLLVRAGMEPAEAVAAGCIGYSWGVAFGSLGSPYFIALSTAGLPPLDAGEFALRTALLLAGNCVLATVLAVRRAPAGTRGEAVPAALTVGAVMAGAVVVTAVLQPALTSILSGLVGVAACWALFRPVRGDGEVGRAGPLLAAAAPYLVLIGCIVTAGLPPFRQLSSSVALGPGFMATSAGYGHINPAEAQHTPLQPLQHPLLFLLAASATAVVWYWQRGWLSCMSLTEAARTTVRRAKPTVGSILGLTVIAALMVDSGMITALAGALASGLGRTYVALAPAIGTAGTFVIGNNTASNALLAPLQMQAAHQINISAPLLLAAQGAGATIGNTLAPVNILIGAVAVGCAGQEGAIIRRNLPDAALLLSVTTTLTLIQLMSA